MEENQSSTGFGKTIALVVPLAVTGLVFVIVVMAGMSETRRIPGWHPLAFMSIITIFALAFAFSLGLLVRWVMPDHWKNGENNGGN